MVIPIGFGLLYQYYLLTLTTIHPLLKIVVFWCHENEKYLLELKESLLIMRDRSSMNRSVCSTPSPLPHPLFEWVPVTLFFALCGLLWSVFLLALCKLFNREKTCKSLDLNYKHAKWLDNKQKYSVQNASPIIFKKLDSSQKVIFFTL